MAIRAISLHTLGAQVGSRVFGGLLVSLAGFTDFRVGGLPFSGGGGLCSWLQAWPRVNGGLGTVRIWYLCLCEVAVAARGACAVI